MLIFIKRKTVYMITAFLICAIAVSVGFVVHAKEIDIGSGAYVNIRNYCVEGATGVSTTTDGAYEYERLNGAIAQLRMMYISESNTGEPLKTSMGEPIWAYCLEYGQDINSATKRVAVSPMASQYWQSLSDDTREAIELAAIYGFPSNDDLGVAAADAYAATQVVIWEFQTGMRSLAGGNNINSVNYKGKTFSADRFYSMFKDGNRDRQGMIAYNRLLDEIYSHFATPDFGVESARLTYDEETQKYSATLEDKNEVLDKYEVSCDETALTIMVEGNTLVLTGEDIFEEATIMFTKKLSKTYGQTMLVLEAEGEGQVTYVGTREKEVTSNLSVVVEPKPEPEPEPEPEPTEPVTLPEEPEPANEIPDTADPNMIGLFAFLTIISGVGAVSINKALKC